MSVLRSELYRTLTPRSSRVALAGATALGLVVAWFSVDAWSLFAGLAAFGAGSVTTARHYRHRTAVLVFLGQPRRLRVLTARCATAVLVALVVTVISGVPAMGSRQFLVTLLVAPLMAILGLAGVTVAVRVIHRD